MTTYTVHSDTHQPFTFNMFDQGVYVRALAAAMADFRDIATLQAHVDAMNDILRVVCADRPAVVWVADEVMNTLMQTRREIRARASS